MRQRFSVFWVICASVLAFAQPARANMITYYYDTWLGTGAAPGTAPFGEVHLDDHGTSDVTVTVSLYNGLGFVNTSAGESLLWELTSGSPVTIQDLSSGFSVTNNGTSTGNQDGSGTWHYAVNCGGDGCGNGGSAPYVGPLSFKILNVGLGDFTTNNNGFYFASDVCQVVSSSSSRTGWSCGTNPTGDIASNTTVPEPGAVALLSAGLAVLGIARRRRRALKI